MDTKSENVENLLGDKSTNNSNDNGGKTENAAPSEKLYALPDGRKVTGEQAIEEYNSLHGDYTLKSQELAKLKKTPEQVNANDSDTDLTDPKDRALATELRRLGFVRESDATKIADARFND